METSARNQNVLGVGKRFTDSTGEFKLCTGPLHREGERLPLRQFHRHRDGTPFSQCKDCRNHYLGREKDSGLVPVEDALPVLQRLFAAAGGKTKAAELLGLPRQYFSRGQQSIRRKTFDAACRLISNLEGPPRNRGEAEVVSGKDLSVILTKWKENWEKERPISRNDHFMGPITYLANETGIHERRIWSLYKGEFENVPLSQADAVLTVIGQNYRFGVDLQVIPNPQWSMEKWTAYMRERGCI